jgi:hypothetical protein
MASLFVCSNHLRQHHGSHYQMAWHPAMSLCPLVYAASHPGQPLFIQHRCLFPDEQLIAGKINAFATEDQALSLNALSREASTLRMGLAAAFALPCAICRATATIKAAHADQFKRHFVHLFPHH